MALIVYTLAIYIWAIYLECHTVAIQYSNVHICNIHRMPYSRSEVFYCMALIVYTLEIYVLAIYIECHTVEYFRFGKTHTPVHVW